MRRLVLLLLVLLVGAFGYVGLRRAAAADRCAEQALARIGAHDRPWLAGQDLDRGTLEALAAAQQVELAFHRPLDPEVSRLGLVVRSGTTASLLVLRVDRGCRLSPDYEGGPFGR